MFNKIIIHLYNKMDKFNKINIFHFNNNNNLKIVILKEYHVKILIPRMGATGVINVDLFMTAKINQV